MTLTHLKSKFCMLWIVLLPLLALSLAILAYRQHPKFGQLPRGQRLEKIKASPNYHKGQFQNQEPTRQITSDKNRIHLMGAFLFEKKENTRPTHTVPTIKTDLKKLNIKNNLLVWFGHSSFLIQISGKRILLDPVFEAASPFSFFNKAFKGTQLYEAADMPPIDYIILTHDHWDHLDYPTLLALKDQVQKVVCPLGVGQHLEYWGYTKGQIVEMDWHQKEDLNKNIAIYCLPARHFSGRTFKPNQTLWASYMIELKAEKTCVNTDTNTQSIYLSGDGGYGVHYTQIANQFKHIDLAIMENGQYNKDWRHIHLMPLDLEKAIRVLNPKKVLTGHHGKYALAKHPWDEPLKTAADLAAKSDFPPMLMPMIGEVVYFQNSVYHNKPWWKATAHLQKTKRGGLGAKD